MYKKTGCENYFKAKFFSGNKWGIPEIEKKLLKKKKKGTNK